MTLAAPRHSPLHQIDKTNVARLREAWTFDSGGVSYGSTLPSRTAFETKTLIVDGVLCLTTPFCRVIALDPEKQPSALGLRSHDRPDGSDEPPG